MALSDTMHATQETLADGGQAGLRALRGSRAKRNAIMGIAFQAATVLSQMVGLGILIRAEGAERFGLWMTVVALTALLLPLATLGQHSALVSRLSAVAHTDPLGAARVFTASCVLLGVASCVVATALVTIGPSVAWSQLLNADGPLTRGVAAKTAIIGLLASIVTFPALHAAYAIYARQDGYLVHLASIASAVLALSGLALAVRLSAPLWAIGALTLAGPSIAGLGLWARGIAIGLVPRPRIALIDRATLKAQFAAGMHFVVIDVATLVLLRTPELIVARLHGVEAVARFAAASRFSMLMLALAQALLMPLWPAIGEAEGRGDREWIGRMGRRSLVLVVAMCAAGGLCVIILGPPVIRLWTGHPELVDRPLLAAAALQSLGQALLVWLAVFLSGLSRQRFQVAVTGTAAFVFVGLAYALGQRFGPFGVALAQAAALLLVATPLALRALWPILKT